MFKWLILWFSFSGAFFFSDYKVPESDLLVVYGNGYKVVLKTHQTYTLTNWNVYKGAISGMSRDLAQMLNESDFVHIQEFLLDDSQEKQVEDFSTYRWMFAKSFQDKDDWTGVVTISRWQPFEMIPLRSADAEPFANTPKMSLIVKYKIENGQELWLANMHALNFNIDHKAFKRHVDDVVNVLNTHNGPIIFAGDFNTWAPVRVRYLLQKTKALGMSEVDLASSLSFMGARLDHIFYRNLQDVKGSVLEDIQTSDHLPMRIEFSL
jgi:endonuclease/exonuclease/phosphatase (EEP) superfamily protein YafD